MSKLIYQSQYNGVPAAQRDALEAVAQGTVTALFEYAQKIYALAGKGRVDYGDLDYSIQAAVVEDEYQKDKPFKRLRVTDHSSGWWADLQWRQPFPESEDYGERIDFCVFASQGEPKDFTRKVKMSEWGWGHCDMFWDACRHDASEGWSSSTNLFDFRHPLLMHLEQAIEEHAED
jgi:hypothetical protein